MKSRLQIVAKRGQPDAALPVLEIERLGKWFKTNEPGPKQILKDIDFTVRQGEMVCILGRSGCGKSTLLKILAGFLAPSSGRARLNGRPVSRPGPDRGVVFQEDALFPWLTVRENIAFGLKGRPLGRGEKKRETERFLSLVGLADFGGYLPSEISGGMKQRISLARVLALQPQVLLMDEPFAALDAQTREEMQDLLLGIWAELAHTIIFVTHDVGEAVLLADRIILMGKDPGCVREDLRIGLSRPRRKDTDGYFAQIKAIAAKMKAI